MRYVQSSIVFSSSKTFIVRYTILHYVCQPGKAVEVPYCANSATDIYELEVSECEVGQDRYSSSWSESPFPDESVLLHSVIGSFNNKTIKSIAARIAVDQILADLPFCFF